MLTQNEFISGIKKLPAIIYSKTGRASYTSFNVVGNKLYFKRGNPQTEWDLDILTLYKIYRTQSFIDTSVVKNITNERVNSPSVAILMALGCIDHQGRRI